MPMFMIQHLARASRQGVMTDNRYHTQLKKTRKRKAGSDGDPPDDAQLTRRVTFDPLPAMEIDLSSEPDGED